MRGLIALPPGLEVVGDQVQVTDQHGHGQDPLRQYTAPVPISRNSDRPGIEADAGGIVLAPVETWLPIPAPTDPGGEVQGSCLLGPGAPGGDGRCSGPGPQAKGGGGSGDGRWAAIGPSWCPNGSANEVVAHQPGGVAVRAAARAIPRGGGIRVTPSASRPKRKRLGLFRAPTTPPLPRGCGVSSPSQFAHLVLSLSRAARWRIPWAAGWAEAPTRRSVTCPSPTALALAGPQPVLGCETMSAEILMGEWGTARCCHDVGAGPMGWMTADTLATAHRRFDDRWSALPRQLAVGSAGRRR